MITAGVWWFIIRGYVIFIFNRLAVRDLVSFEDCKILCTTDLFFSFNFNSLSDYYDMCKELHVGIYLGQLNTVVYRSIVLAGMSFYFNDCCWRYWSRYERLQICTYGAHHMHIGLSCSLQCNVLRSLLICI